jgi:hypothetical protein
LQNAGLFILKTIGVRPLGETGLCPLQYAGEEYYAQLLYGPSSASLRSLSSYRRSLRTENLWLSGYYLLWRELGQILLLKG